MRTKIKNLLLLAMIGSSVTLGACVTQQKQVLEKSTVFGFQAVTPGGQGYSTKIQIGLVRNEYWSNPTGTNKIYAADYQSHVTAKLSAMNQSANETFGTFELPDAIYQTGTNSP